MSSSSTRRESVPGAKARRVIIIGAGVAGLCAARVLSEHFEKVTLIERDELPEGAEHRSGVPQSHHGHALLLRGLRELETLFPGIRKDFLALGARTMDMGGEFAHFSEWGWAKRATIGLAPLVLSRVLLESVVRRRVRTDVKNLEILEHTRVKRLLAKRAQARVTVTGIETEHTQLDADLIVDASGRTSKAPRWLEQLGVKPPEEIVVDAFCGYASRFYELAPDATRWWRGMLVDAAPPDFKRWALLTPVENNRVVLMLGGVNHEYPPTDEQGFHDYLRSLRTPVLAQEIARAKPVSEIHGFRSLWNRARRYDSWDAEVHGFIAMGDAAIAFNAFHGQGTSMAALSATTLQETLNKVGTDPERLPAAFHRAQWGALRMAWDIATGMDLQWPGTEGKRPLSFRLLRGFGVEGTRAACEDAEVKKRLAPVLQLIDSPYSTLRPGLLTRILWLSLKRRAVALLKSPPREVAKLPSDTETAAG